MDLLVLRLSALGDVIHTLPAVQFLRAAGPARAISWAVEAPYAELVEIVAGVQPLPLRLKAWGRAPFASRQRILAARRSLRSPSVSVDFQGLVKSAALGLLSGAPVRYGFDRSTIREKAASLFSNRHVHVDASRHVVEQNLELAAALCERPALDEIDAVTLRKEIEERFARFASDPTDKLSGLEGSVVILPGAGKAAKLWPARRFSELASAIGPRVVTAWGPGERSLADSVGGRIAPETNLRELAWLLRHAAVVIGADTGPLHLAAALGTKVLGLYAPTDPGRNGPWGQLDRCVSRFRSTKLMDSISVEEVVQRLRRVEAE